MDINELKTLYKTCDKTYLHAIFNLLRMKDEEEKGSVKDPVWKEKVKINRTSDFLNLWSLYLNTLVPLLKQKPIKERITLVHMIYGTAIKKSDKLFFHWPSLQYIAVLNIKKLLEEHKNFILQKEIYEIK
jgi:hypothetical protein